MTKALTERGLDLEKFRPQLPSQRTVGNYPRTAEQVQM
jgi:hypothetical protein